MTTQIYGRNQTSQRLLSVLAVLMGLVGLIGSVVFVVALSAHDGSWLLVGFDLVVLPIIVLKLARRVVR